jgi:hypothetical protein
MDNDYFTFSGNNIIIFKECEINPEMFNNQLIYSFKN